MREIVQQYGDEAKRTVGTISNYDHSVIRYRDRGKRCIHFFQKRNPRWFTDFPQHLDYEIDGDLMKLGFRMFLFMIISIVIDGNYGCHVAFMEQSTSYGPHLRKINIGNEATTPAITFTECIDCDATNCAMVAGICSGQRWNVAASLERTQEWST